MDKVSFLFKVEQINNQLVSKTTNQKGHFTMKILFVASECTPFVRTCGLADVIGALPRELAKDSTNQVRVILPKYYNIPEYLRYQMQYLLSFRIQLGWRSEYCGIEYIELDNVIYYFIDNEFYFGENDTVSDGSKEGEKFAYFTRAVLDALPHIGFQPDIVHAHDWQAGMVCALLKTQYKKDDFYQNIRSVFTIHNLQHQGNFEWKSIFTILGLPDRYFTSGALESYGNSSFIKGGVVFADHLSTVSPTYAQEIQEPFFGEGLDTIFRNRSSELSGILNGIDIQEYNANDDSFLQTHFSIEDMQEKSLCRQSLQEKLLLQPRTDIPIIAIVSRLCVEKGMDLVEKALDELMQMNIQLVVLGEGCEHFQEFFSWASWRYQGQMSTSIGLDTALAHQIYAGSDLFLMPSAFEPCGYSQMISMRYGTLPIVRETGGLKDSVMSYSKWMNDANGFSFTNYDSSEMLSTIEEAISMYHEKEAWQQLQHNAMRTDVSWRKSAQLHMDMYHSLL